jgi:hypothetical protein
MNSKSLLLVGLLSVVPAACVVAAETEKAQTPVAEQAVVVAVEQKIEDTAKKPAVAPVVEEKEVSVQAKGAEAGFPATK